MNLYKIEYFHLLPNGSNTSKSTLFSHCIYFPSFCIFIVRQYLPYICDTYVWKKKYIYTVKRFKKWTIDKFYFFDVQIDNKRLICKHKLILFRIFYLCVLPKIVFSGLWRIILWWIHFIVLSRIIKFTCLLLYYVMCLYF